MKIMDFFRKQYLSMLSLVFLDTFRYVKHSRQAVKKFLFIFYFEFFACRVKRVEKSERRRMFIVASLLIIFFSSQQLMAWEWPWQKQKTVEDKRLDLQRRQINDPANPYINYNMGVIQYKKREFDGAAGSFGRAIQHLPDKPFLKKQVYFNLGQTEYRRAQGVVGPSWQKEKVSDEVIDKALVLANQSIKQFDGVLVLEAEHVHAKKMKAEVELFQKKLLAKKYENQQKKDQQNSQENKDNKNKKNSDGKDQEGQSNDGNNKNDDQRGDDKDKQGKAGDKKNKDGQGNDEQIEQDDAGQNKDQQTNDGKNQKDEQKSEDSTKQKDKSDDKVGDDQKLQQAKDRGHQNGKKKDDKNVSEKSGEKAGEKPKAMGAEGEEPAGEATNRPSSDQQAGNEDTMERVMDAHTKSVLDAVEQMEGNAQKRAMAYELSKMGAQRVGGSQKPW
jgi:hypothetical protein